jgi:hypothetical protein
MSSATPLGDQEIGQLRQAPNRERQAVLSGPGPGVLLDLPPLRQRGLERPAALVSRVERAEPVRVEVTDHVPHPVLAGEGDLRDRRYVHARRRHSTIYARHVLPNLCPGARSAPGTRPHHRGSRAPATALPPAQSRGPRPTGAAPGS